MLSKSWKYGFPKTGKMRFFEKIMGIFGYLGVIHESKSYCLRGWKPIHWDCGEESILAMMTRKGRIGEGEGRRNWAGARERLPAEDLIPRSGPNAPPS